MECDVVILEGETLGTHNSHGLSPHFHSVPGDVMPLLLQVVFQEENLFVVVLPHPAQME